MEGPSSFLACRLLDVERQLRNNTLGEARRVKGWTIVLMGALFSVVPWNGAAWAQG
jgi:hypothetical protein